MSLQKKTLLIIFITFLSLGFLGFITLRLTLFESYLNLEEDNVKLHVQRIENSITDELLDMEQVTADWAYWTDSYNYMLGNNSGYIEDNYDLETLVNLELNIMLLIDLAGKQINIFQLDLEKKEDVINPEFLTNLQKNYPKILVPQTSIEPRSGIFMTAEGPILIAICPILRNDKTGPSPGNLIVGRYLDEQLVNRISRLSKLSVKVYSFITETTSETANRAKLYLSQDTTKVSIPKSSEEVSGFALISDILGNPILILEVTVPRDILAKAKQSFTMFALIFIIVLLVVMLVINNLLNKLIMVRMKQLSNQADQIALNGEFDRELEFSGKDEIANLGETFNLMLKSLRESHNQTVEMNLKLEEMVEKRTTALQESNERLLVEVEERSEVQKQLEVSLEEKVLLLKEVYHRVKNNLQVISSLLNLQSGQSDSAEVKKALQASRSRVHSMSLVHEQLYRNDSLRYIAVKRYLGSIVAHLFGLYNGGNRNVSYEIISDDFNMTINQVIPCGLIVTELVSNSFKYAFKGLEEGKVLIHLYKHEDDKATLEISDNGKGLPEEFDPEKSRSLGLKLVHSLARQLGGELITDLDSSKFSITFKHASGEE